jgi:hypothetical protein
LPYASLAADAQGATSAAVTASIFATTTAAGATAARPATALAMSTSAQAAIS